MPKHAQLSRVAIGADATHRRLRCQGAVDSPHSVALMVAERAEEEEEEEEEEVVVVVVVPAVVPAQTWHPLPGSSPAQGTPFCQRTHRRFCPGRRLDVAVDDRGRI